MQLPSTADRPQRARLLFVEGDRVEREATAAVLSQSFDVTAVPDAAGALALLAGQPFDVICAAEVGAGGDGRELLARAAALPQAPRGVLLTAQTDEPAFLVGSAGFQVVFKPYEPQQLIDTVHRELTLARMRRLLPVGAR